MGFNSLCALASVNHQHIHAWTLEHKIYLEHAVGSSLLPAFVQAARNCFFFIRHLFYKESKEIFTTALFLHLFRNYYKFL